MGAEILSGQAGKIIGGMIMERIADLRFEISKGRMRAQSVGSTGWWREFRKGPEWVCESESASGGVAVGLQGFDGCAEDGWECSAR